MFRQKMELLKVQQAESMQAEKKELQKQLQQLAKHSQTQAKLINVYKTQMVRGLCNKNFDNIFFE